MTNRFHGYQQLISDATGVTAIALIDEIEECMRGETLNGCLDHLPSAEFKKLAGICSEVIGAG